MHSVNDFARCRIVPRWVIWNTKTARVIKANCICRAMSVLSLKLTHGKQNSSCFKINLQISQFFTLKSWKKYLTISFLTLNKFMAPQNDHLSNTTIILIIISGSVRTANRFLHRVLKKMVLRKEHEEKQTTCFSTDVRFYSNDFFKLLE